MSSDGEPDFYMSGAAISPPGHKDKPPAVTIPLRDRQYIREYFFQRRAQHSGKPSPVFASDSPHTCIYCEAIVLDLDQLRAATVIPLCGSLEAAIDRATAKCAFFEWMIGLLVGKESSSDPAVLFQGDTCAEITFGIRLSPWNRGMPMRLHIWAEFIEADGEFCLERLDGDELFACTDEDDLAASYVPSRPYEPNKESSRNVLFLRNNLKDCLTDHLKCRLASMNTTASAAESILVEDLPTRLLRIESGGQFVRLVTVTQLSARDKTKISQLGYASLSYCWGGPQPLCLTNKTIQTLTQGIEAVALPHTLRDAAVAVSSLGLEYMWIDALCIKQDDPEDKALEIARMSLYYGWNTVTISAASAAACTEGFLASGPVSEIFKSGPFRVSLATPDGLGSIQLTRYTDEPPEPIASRAWTFQESLLSRRLAIFGSREVRWTCNTATGSYGGPNPMSESRYSLADTEMLGTTQNLTNVLSDWPKTTHAWSNVVKQFTTRALGVESDKLLAIAAIASFLADEAERQSTPMEYLAGLFIKPQHVISWADQLFWRVDLSRGTRRAGAYRAPSWSWACIDGAWLGGLGRYTPYPPDIKKYDFDFRVTDFAVELAYPSAPFGSIRSAFLVVRGWVKRLDGELKPRVEFSSTDSIFLADKDRTGADLVVVGDTTEDVESIQAIVKGQEKEPEVYLLELIPAFPPRGNPSLGLILKGGFEESWARVGVYALYAEAEFHETFFDGIAENLRLV